WGDGTPVDVFTATAGSTTVTRNHTYADDSPTTPPPGGYPISASVTDAGPSVITGPNAAGYRAYDDPFWRTDLTPGGAGNTTIMGTGQDDFATTYDLGTDTFTFYGVTYTGSGQMFVSSNGLITFGTSNSSLSNVALTSGPTQAAIAPYWDDMITDSVT